MSNKRRSYLKLFALVLWALCTVVSGRLFFGSLISSGNLLDTIAQLENSNGLVAFRKPNSILWNDVEVDQLFCDGDIVSTSNRSNARIQTGTGHIIELQANTMIKLRAEGDSDELVDRRFVLKLIKGSLIAKRDLARPRRSGSPSPFKPDTSNKLKIETGDQVFEIPSEPATILGIAKSDSAKPAVVFRSTGKNLVFNTRSSDSEPVAPIDSAVPKFSRRDNTPTVGNGSLPIVTTTIPKLAFDIVLPIATLMAPVKLAEPVAVSAATLPKKPRRAHVVFKAVKIVKKPVEVVVKNYPAPLFKNQNPVQLISFNRLQGSCNLGTYNLEYRIAQVSNIENDWQPVAEVKFEGNPSTDIIKLEKNPGEHQVGIPLEKICKDSVFAPTQSKWVSINIGYTKADLKLIRTSNLPVKITVTSIAGFSKIVNLTFAPGPTGTRGVGFLMLEASSSKKAGKVSVISISPAANSPTLFNLLPEQRLIGISYSEQMNEKLGVYLVRKADVLLGYTGRVPPDSRIDKTANKMGADHGFIGYPRYLRNLEGAPVNKLSVLETIARNTGPVTVIARGNAFDMSVKDFEKGSRELLWMASTVSAVYSEKPQKIFFP